ncbi:hypothetical protein [Hymenobacter sp. IS2118]|uniref:hypothetical protein n=1 Tax=Hymenobacter sp. IS2118 TaxID=1505605 RepID=UPI000558EEB1|nr:hypothetical protein [Hymenobacter sp. IS2118]
MEIQLMAGHIRLGIVEARVVDSSMGVIGGKLQASNEYYADFQQFFRAHNKRPDWQKLQEIELVTVSQVSGILTAQGGICIEDVEGFDDIEVQVCGVDFQVVREFLSL